MRTLKGSILILLSVLTIISCKKESKTPLPIADFKVASIGENYEVTFENLSEYGETYIWDFGDGTTSTDESPVHSFKRGESNITLNVKNSTGETKISKIIKLESQEKVAVQINEGYDITNAGFNMSWNIADGRAGSSYSTYVQISEKEDFSSHSEVYEAIAINGTCSDEFIKINPPHTVLWFRNLTPNKQYFFRIKLVYTYNGDSEDIYSETKSINTIDMQIPELEVSEDVNAKTYFTVKTSLSKFAGWFTNPKPANLLEFAYDKDFTNSCQPEKMNSFFDTYCMEPGETIYVKSTYTYKGVSKSVIKSINMPEVFSDNDGWKGDRAIAYNYNGKKIFEMGAADGKRLVFQIAGFKGVGEYELEGSPDNTIDDTYAYFFKDGNNANIFILKHFQTVPLTLYIYKETNDEYYGRIGSGTDNNTWMSFRGDDGSSVSVSGMIFKATKQ